ILKKIFLIILENCEYPFNYPLIKKTFCTLDTKECFGIIEKRKLFHDNLKSSYLNLPEYTLRLARFEYCEQYKKYNIVFGLFLSENLIYNNREFSLNDSNDIVEDYETTDEECILSEVIDGEENVVYRKTLKGDKISISEKY